MIVENLLTACVWVTLVIADCREAALHAPQVYRQQVLRTRDDRLPRPMAASVLPESELIELSSLTVLHDPRSPLCSLTLIGSRTLRAGPTQACPLAYLWAPQSTRPSVLCQFSATIYVMLVLATGWPVFDCSARGCYATAKECYATVLMTCEGPVSDLSRGSAKLRSHSYCARYLQVTHHGLELIRADFDSRAQESPAATHRRISAAKFELADVRASRVSFLAKAASTLRKPWALLKGVGGRSCCEEPGKSCEKSARRSKYAFIRSDAYKGSGGSSFFASSVSPRSSSGRVLDTGLFKVEMSGFWCRRLSS